MAELTWQAAAAANILQARKKKGRQVGSKKSRNGCMTCKLRRIKCDETRGPSGCEKCSSSGRLCPGYDLNPSSPSPTARGGNKKNSNFLIGQQLSSALGLSEGDRRTFDYFLSWTAPRLAGSLDKDFWCGQVLQMARAEPLVLNALLAISTLYEYPQFMTSFLVEDQSGEVETPFAEKPTRLVHPSIARPPPDEHHALALKYYNRAINAAMDRIGSGKGSPLLALLSCVLFVCIEVLRDDILAALSLLEGGLQLFRQMKPSYDSADADMLLNLKLMFTRLGVMAGFISRRSLDLPPEMKLFVDTRESLDDLTESRASLFALIAESNSFIDDALAYKENFESAVTYIDRAQEAELDEDDGIMFYTGRLSVGINMRSIDSARSLHARPPSSVTQLAFRKDPEIEMPAGRVLHTSSDQLQQSATPILLLERQKHQHSSFQQWYSKFQATPHRDERAAASLLMQYHSVVVRLHSLFSPTETVFDQFLDHFREILRLAEICINPGSERQTFSFELGILAPLYFVAVKCRIPSIRRKAVELMGRATLKEGTFGAKASAEMAARIIDIEEDGLRPCTSPRSASTCSSEISDTIILPESARIHYTEIVMNGQKVRFDIRIVRFRPDASGTPVRLVHEYPL